MTSPLFPATYIQLPSGYENQRAAFYLAIEEYVATNMPQGNYIMTWQIHRTVVMGRNQDAKAEIDLDFCRKEGIDVIRRKSGGGSIYADYGNIMTSLITGSGAVEPVFAEYATAIAACLGQLGADVIVSGRNDICMANGGKICGNAFYHLAHRNIAHGTMLYDTDTRLMQGALTPDKAKLQSNGVKSVASRISLLKDTLPGINVDELRNHIRQCLTDSTLLLTQEDVARIREIELGYYIPSFLFGKDYTHNGRTYSCSSRIDGCGTVSLQFSTQDGIITATTLHGDFLELDQASTLFHKTFLGCRLAYSHMMEAIDRYKPYNSIRGMDRSSLCRLIESMLRQTDI